MQNVVVIFQATKQYTEGLALALGLGAVQSGANIRLRHLDPSSQAELAHAGYGILKTEDLRWAEGVAILLESARPTGLEELTATLKEMAGDSRTTHKWAYLFHPDSESESKRFVQSMVRSAGYRQLGDGPDPSASGNYMTQIGQQLAGLTAEKE